MNYQHISDDEENTENVNEKIINLLKENDFLEINQDNIEKKDNYYTSNEISRLLEVRLDHKSTDQLLLACGLKTYIEKKGVPANPEKTAFIVRYREKEISDEDDSYVENDDIVYEPYIVPLYHKSVIGDMNEFLINNEQFSSIKKEIIENNYKEKVKVVDYFKKNTNNYVYVDVVTSGYSLKNDFVIMVSFIEVENSEIINKEYLMIDDDIDTKKSNRYYFVNEKTGMSPYDYIKIDLPYTENNQYKFVSRINALRYIYKKTVNKNACFYNESAFNFIQKMFESEDLIKNSTPNIVKNIVYLNDYLDWNEEKQSIKPKDLFEKYGIIKNKNNGLLAKAMAMVELAEKSKKNYKSN